MGRPHQAGRLGVTHRRGLDALQEVQVFLRHRGGCDLDQQPVFQPELDDVEERLAPPHAASEGLGAPALASTDPLDLVRLMRHRQQYVERPSLRGCWIFTKHDLIVMIRYVERRALRVDLDHRAVRIAARRHEGACERAERKALAVHQFG